MKTEHDENSRKAERALRHLAIVRAITIALLGAMVALWLTSCSDPVEDLRPANERKYDFTIQTQDPAHRGFVAVVSWGVNKVQYADPVKGGLSYSSAAYMRPLDTFTICVETEYDVELVWRGAINYTVHLKPGVTYTFDYYLDQK